MSDIENWYMKKPCKHCPFRKDVKPFLHPDRAYQLAEAASNPFNSFTCHKTIDHDDDGEGIITEVSKECAGFLTIRAQETERGLPEGFEPASDDCYADTFAMEFAYQKEWNNRRGEQQ